MSKDRHEIPPVTERYLPAAKGTFKGQAQNVFRRLAYRLWKAPLVDLQKNQGARNLRVADIGCGPGFLLESIQLWFPAAELTGVDASGDLLDCLKLRCPNARTVCGDARALPLESSSTDALFCLHVVEHLENPSSFFAEAQRVLRSGGLLAIATPNASGFCERVMKARWQGYSDPTHICLHGPNFWRDLIASSGFAIQSDGTTGLSGIPILKSSLLGLVQRLPLLLFGFFPWDQGEAYICVARRL